jgi:hypothetical protein
VHQRLSEQEAAGQTDPALSFLQLVQRLTRAEAVKLFVQVGVQLGGGQGSGRGPGRQLGGWAYIYADGGWVGS